MRCFIVKVNCLGCKFTDIFFCASACLAIIAALDKYPRACAVDALPAGGVA